MHAREKMFSRNRQALAWEDPGRVWITLGRRCLLTVQDQVCRRGPSAATLKSFGGFSGVTPCSVSGLWNTSGAGVGSTLRCFCGVPGMTPRASLPELASALMPGNIKTFRSILFLFQGSCTGQPCLFSAPLPTPWACRSAGL